jgi:hypothetical protein
LRFGRLGIRTLCQSLCCRTCSRPAVSPSLLIKQPLFGRKDGLPLLFEFSGARFDHASTINPDRSWLSRVASVLSGDTFNHACPPLARRGNWFGRGSRRRAGTQLRPGVHTTALCRELRLWLSQSGPTLHIHLRSWQRGVRRWRGTQQPPVCCRNLLGIDVGPTKSGSLRNLTDLASPLLTDFGS